MIRVLIADDNNKVRRGLRSTLEAIPGVQVCAEAEDGIEAVRKAADTRPDLVILDIVMPNANGFEAATKLRSAARHFDSFLFRLPNRSNGMASQVGWRSRIYQQDGGN